MMVTPDEKGLIRYTLVKSGEIHLLRIELNLRLVNFDPNTNITGLRKLILKNEGDKNDKMCKSFKPIDMSIYEHLLA